MPRVIVMGGSLGGLTAALVLRDAGCDVRVFERSSSALQARGAGHRRARRHAALPDRARRLPAGGRVLVDRLDPLPAPRREHPSTSSGTATGSRRGTRSTGRCSPLFDAGRYLLGREVTAFDQDGDGVSVTLADGASAEADLLVCADGVELGGPGAAAPGRQRRRTRDTSPGAARCPEQACPLPPARRSTTRSSTRCSRTATSSSTRSPAQDGVADRRRPADQLRLVRQRRRRAPTSTSS